MKQVLLFPEHDQDELSYEQIYLCVIHRDTDMKNKLQDLSPKVMTWKDGIFLVDLGFCIHYWKTIAAHRKVECIKIWQEILERIFEGKAYFGSLSFHPWQSLLLAHTLEDIGVKGLSHVDSTQGKNIFPHISWQQWWRHGEDIIDKKISLGFMAATHKNKFQQNLRKMQISMKRLGCQRPIHISHMSPSQILRRYGKEIQLLWEWTYHYNKDEAINTLEDCDQFPWVTDSQEDTPIVKRHLELPTFTWSTLEEYLRDDLNRLCRSPNFNKGERIMSLEWRIILHDLSEIIIPISFRNPHNLHQETPHQRTALLQIRYQFEAYASEQKRKYDDIEAPPPPISSWSLTASNIIMSSSYLEGLFDSQQSSIRELLEIENQLPMGLDSYQVIDHWLPEEDFKPTSGSPKVGPSMMHPGQDPDARPLFTYKNPRPLPHPSGGGAWKFTERTMDKWWVSKSKNLRRDYYHYVNEDGKHWVFRDTKGRWFLHGIFA